MNTLRIQAALQVELFRVFRGHNIGVGTRREPGIMHAHKVCHHSHERDTQPQFADYTYGHKIDNGMNRDDDIGLHSCEEAQQSIEDQRAGNRVQGHNGLFAIAAMKEFAKQPGGVADRRAIEFDDFTQRKTTISLKNIDDFDAIGRWRLLTGLLGPIFPGSLAGAPLLLLPLLDKPYSIADGIGCAAVAGPGVSNEE